MSTALPRILVLSRNHEAHGVSRLVEAAASRTDCRLHVIDPQTLRLHNTAAGPRVSHDVLELDPHNTVVIPRLASLASEFALYCFEQLEACGFASLSPFRGLSGLRHKFSALTALSLAGIPVPDSVMLRNQSELGPAVDSVGGYPLILKFIRGSQGIGVILAEREDTVSSVLDALNAVQYDVLLQRYIPEAALLGTYRVLVIGGRARYAVHLTPASGSERSNVHAGGQARLQALTPELSELSERANAVFKLGFSGVDLVDTAGGLQILEVNGSPGFVQPELLHKVDIAGELIEAALALLPR